MIPYSPLNAEIEEFKKTYVTERRVLERCRKGIGREYTPSPTLDGVSRWDTPEVKKPQNEWEAAYKKLLKAVPDFPPAKYVRILFRLLRGSSLATPEPRQLASERMIELFRDYLKDKLDDLFIQLKTEADRAKVSININQKGAGYSLALSVYYAVLDERLDLSPLFRYCLCLSTVKLLESHEESEPYCEQLRNLAKRYELLAAMDYTLFPDEYDKAWGEIIPTDFRVAASAMLSS